MKYNQYLNTAHWKQTRTRLLHSKGRRCKICKTKINIQVHHKTYIDDSGKSILFNERNHQLIPLCNQCHLTWHKIYGKREIRVHDYIRASILLEWGATRIQAIMLSTHREFGIEWMREKIKSKTLFPRWGNAAFELRR